MQSLVRQDTQPPNLTEAEIQAAVGRCPEDLRGMFGGWLRRTHHLDGELIRAEGGN